jgi:hypothetical protein
LEGLFARLGTLQGRRPFFSKASFFFFFLLKGYG